MPDEKYFDLIEKLIIKYSDKGINTLLLSDADIKRMPTSFVNNINKNSCTKRRKPLRFPMRELTQKADLLFAKAVR